MKPPKHIRKPIVIARKRLLEAMSRAASHIMQTDFIEPTQQQQLFKIPITIGNNVKRHYLADSHDSPGRSVSYAQSQRHTYDTDKRTKTTLARYIRRQSIGTVSDALLTSYCQLVGSYLHDGSGFDVISGNAIVEFYRDKDISGSCMCGDYSEFTRVYADNPSKVTMLTYEEGELNARALLWNASGQNGSVKLMDRIYPNDGHHVNLFHKWARANGYLVREHNGLPCGRVGFFDRPDGERLFNFTVELSHNDVVPYLDSFHFGEYDHNTLYLSTHSGEHKFSSTDGSLPNSVTQCENCGENHDEEDMYSIDDGMICPSCFSNTYFFCERCDLTTNNDKWTEVDGSGWCEHCVNSYSTECISCNYRSSASMTAANSGNSYCDDCLDNLTECSDCYSMFKDDTNLQTRDGNLVCENCMPEPEGTQCTQV